MILFSIIQHSNMCPATSLTFLPGCLVPPLQRHLQVGRNLLMLLYLHDFTYASAKPQHFYT